MDFFGMEMLSAEYVGNNLACHKFSFLSGPSLSIIIYYFRREILIWYNLKVSLQKECFLGKTKPNLHKVDCLNVLNCNFY